MDFLADLLGSIGDLLASFFGDDGSVIGHIDTLSHHSSQIHFGDYDSGLIDDQGNHVMSSVHPGQPDYYTAENGATNYWDTRKP